MFKLHSEYKPTGDQPQAIEYLSNGIKEGKKLVDSGDRSYIDVEIDNENIDNIIIKLYKDFEI